MSNPAASPLDQLKQRDLLKRSRRRRPSRPMETLEPRRLFAAGDLDLAFSGDGLHTTDLGSRGGAFDVVTQADGKVILAGQASSLSGLTSDAVLVRFNANGTLDTTFGDGGIARVDFGGNETFAQLVILPGGDIVAGGTTSDTTWMLARFSAEGDRDTTSGFGGTDGVQTGAGQIAQLAVQGTQLISADANNVVRRHNSATGGIDATFGTGGSVTIGGSAVTSLTEFRRLAGLVVQADGKIVVAGTATGDPDDESDDGAEAVNAVARLTASGGTDGSFGTAGGVRIGMDIEASSSSAVGVRPSDGHIFVAGTDAGQDSNLIQFSATGQLVRTRNLPSNSSDLMSGSDILFDAGGHVIIAGRLENPDNDSADVVVARYNTDLTLDAIFSADGLASVDSRADDSVEGNDDSIGGATIDGLGRIVFVGSAFDRDAAKRLVVVARLEGTSPGAVRYFRDTGQLVIDGTNDADTIALTLSGGTITLSRNGATSTYAANELTSITIDALAGNDNVTVAAGIAAPALITGGAGADTVQGGAGNDTLLGGIGADRDVIRGGAGVDVVSYADRADALVITLDGVANDGAAGENDDLAADLEGAQGGTGADHITGNAGANRLGGGAVFDSRDTLIGLAGNDTLEGAARADGGAGNDRFISVVLVDYSNRSDNLTFEYFNTITGGGSGESDEILVANTILQLGSGNDIVRSPFSRAVLEVRGGPGNDLIDLHTEGDPPGSSAQGSVLKGEAGNDTLTGTDGPDTLDGGPGVDVLNGGQHDQLLNGEPPIMLPGVSIQDGVLSFTGTGGNDAISLWDDGGSGLVVWLDGVTQTFDIRQITRLELFGNGGNDLLKLHHLLKLPALLNGGDGDDRLIGGALSDTLPGGNGNDQMSGNNGDDSLDGGLGSDILRGNGGRDTLDYSARVNRLIVGLNGFQDDGEAGENDFACDDIERLIGGGANDKLGGGSGALDQVIYGGPGNDTIYGGGGKDALFGEAGNDRLGGGDGDDYLEGGAGHDALYGDGGADTLLGLAGNDQLFSFGDGSKDSVNGGSGSDSADVDLIDDVAGVEALI